MAHAISAPTRAVSLRPLRAFAITLRTAGQRLAYTALAHSSGDALHDALLLPSVCIPFSASVKPLDIYRRKLALADLVE